MIFINNFEIMISHNLFSEKATIWGVVDINIQEFSLPSKIIFWWFKSVENEQDFEFLTGMLLLGVVVLTKVRGLANFTHLWTFAKTTTPINFSQ
jgi:hypothetical protein